MIKPMRGRLILMALFTLILIIAVSGPVKAQVGVDLKYWYCDENVGLVWPVKAIPTYIRYNPNVPLANLSLSRLHSYVDTAYSRWASALNGKAWKPGPNPPSGYVPMAANPFMWVEPKTVSDLGVPNSYDGVTILPAGSRQFLMYGFYGTKTITIYKIVGPLYVHPLYNSRSGNYSQDKWKIVMTHEMGHAFGYWGHYSSGAVMKASAPTTSYPNTNEIRHLKQLN